MYNLIKYPVMMAPAVITAGIHPLLTFALLLITPILYIKLEDRLGKHE